MCRTSATTTDVIELPPPLAGLFAEVPWSADPLGRFLEKLAVWQALTALGMCGRRNSS